jgi:hypothetical protein
VSDGKQVCFPAMHENAIPGLGSFNEDKDLIVETPVSSTVNQHVC